MSEDRDDVVTSAVPDFFKKFEARFIHDQAVERAKEALRQGAAMLARGQGEGDGHTVTICQQSLDYKLRALCEAFDD